MPSNPTTGMFETLVAAASMAATNTKYPNSFLDCIYTEYQPITAEIGETLNVNIPTVNEGDVNDIADGPLQPTNTAHSNVQISFNKHPSTSWVIKTWDKVRTPENLAQKFISPRLEAVLRSINRTIAGLVTSTNFSSYSVITGSGADLFQKADLTGAWKNLSGAGVPVTDTPNMFFVTSNTAYGNMLGDTNFTSESVVGLSQAEAAQQRALLFNIYGANVRYDLHLAKYTASREPGIYMHRYAIAAVTALLPSSGSPSVMETTLYPKPWLPVQLQMEYSLKDQGWLFNLHAGYGCKVVRPDHGSLVETA
jgi:hypothetical protein